MLYRTRPPLLQRITLWYKGGSSVCLSITNNNVSKITWEQLRFFTVFGIFVYCWSKLTGQGQKTFLSQSEAAETGQCPHVGHIASCDLSWPMCLTRQPAEGRQVRGVSSVTRRPTPVKLMSSTTSRSINFPNSTWWRMSSYCSHRSPAPIQNSSCCSKVTQLSPPPGMLDQSQIDFCFHFLSSI